MPAARIFLQLIADFVVYLGLLIRRRKAIAAENLFLRRQLALYQERKVDPRRIDPATRITLALLSKLFNWRDALVVVQPKTLIRWHRAGFRLLWHWKSKPGRPPIPAELRRLIREMSRDNLLWGEERIANELLVKLGLTPILRPLASTTSRLVSAGLDTASNLGVTLTATNLDRPLAASVAERLARRCRCSVPSARPRLRQNSALPEPLASNSSTNRLTSSRLRRCRLPPASFSRCMKPVDQKPA
jgi:hypothetical protein